MKKVLVVEDYPGLRKIYEIALKNAGYTVDTVSDGGDALEMIMKNNYDVVLLDLLLQRVSGLEFLKVLNAPAKYPNLKIIVISNLSHPEVAKEAMQLGVTKYLVKSEHLPKDIAAEVEQVLKGGK